MRVIVIGAGIGGLAATLSLHAAGIDVDVYDAVPELRPLGVGINLLPHAVRELTELGLADHIAANAIPTARLMYANRFGQEIWSEPRGLAAGYRWPQYSIHRGTLQMLLYAAVRERVGDAHIHLDRTVAQVEENGTAHFISRSGAHFTERADLILAADGIRSAVRAQFYPDEGEPRWNRRVLWRGQTEAKPYLGGATMVMAGHQNTKFVCYPISPEAASRGRSLVNWIAELLIPNAGSWRAGDWNRQGDPTDFLPAFADWHFGWLDVPAIIAGASHIYEYPMLDRDPVERWTFGRVTLLGDAAHAMYPIGSNGASQAILDARYLALELSRQDIDTALARYEAERRPATTRLVLMNRANGPEQVMQTAHERAPNGFRHIHDVMRADELEAVAGAYKKAAGFDRDALNMRASLSPALR